MDTNKNTHYASKLDMRHSPTALWHTLRSLGVLSTGYPSPFLHFTADTLAQHYARISTCSRPLSPEIVNTICSSPLPNAHPTFTLQPITPSYVTKLLSSISSKSMGIDRITSPMLMLASQSLSAPLTSVFNASIASSTFPFAWKHASIIPLSKTSTPTSLNDTRPIALLPEISKLLERVIHSQLLSHLIEHNLLTPHQHGFRPGHSTHTAILDVTERVRTAIDKREISIVVSFDFSKAFDSIPHHKLLMRLREVGCDDMTIRWFASYLSLRTLAVRNVDGSHSAPYQITSGVPQGSVLGPLLFLIFINTLPSILSHSHAVIFADDTQIIAHAPPSQFDDLVLHVGADANAVQRWAQDNGLSLNAQKTLSFPFNTTNPNSRLFLLSHFLSLEKAEWLQRCEVENLTPMPPSLLDTLSLS
ncbi:hypothetical protein TKK_0001340 [Trichogramma kaykai]